MKKQNLFVKLLFQQRSIQELQDLIEGLLTPTEIEDIIKRIKIVQMLKANVPQREIAQKLNVGLATITRGSTELKRGRFSQIKPNPFAWRSTSKS